MYYIDTRSQTMVKLKREDALIKFDPDAYDDGNTLVSVVQRGGVAVTRTGYLVTSKVNAHAMFKTLQQTNWSVTFSSSVQPPACQFTVVGELGRPEMPYVAVYKGTGRVSALDYQELEKHVFRLYGKKRRGAAKKLLQQMRGAPNYCFESETCVYLASANLWGYFHSFAMQWDKKPREWLKGFVK